MHLSLATVQQIYYRKKAWIKMFQISHQSWRLKLEILKSINVITLYLLVPRIRVYDIKKIKGGEKTIREIRWRMVAALKQMSIMI